MPFTLLTCVHPTRRVSDFVAHFLTEYSNSGTAHYDY